MRKIAGYLTKNRSGKDQKIAQSTHENGYIKPRKTFWRNSKQLLNIYIMIATVTIGFIVTVAIVLLNLYVDVVQNSFLCISMH